MTRRIPYHHTRTLARWLHIAVGVMNMVYIYTPINHWPVGFAIVRWVNVPVLVLTGAWLVGGAKIWFAKRLAASPNAVPVYDVGQLGPAESARDVLGAPRRRA